MVNSQSLNAEIKALSFPPYALRFTPNGGFTIVELLVSILLTSIIMGAIYSVYRVQTHSAKIQENRLEAQEYARLVLDMMVREIRNAAYNPTSAISGTNCAGGAPGAPSVVSATATSIRFTYDADANGDCQGANEDITYTRSGNDITRTARSDTGGSLTTETLSNGNVTDLQLQYFTQAGALATGLTDIQRVSISLTIQSKNPDTEFGGQLTATMTSNADLRNRGLPS